MIEIILFVCIFVVISGFFAMIDAAILSVTPAEVEVMLQKKRWGAFDVKQLLRHTTRAIIVIVIFTNLTNILGPILVGRKAVEMYGSESIGIITAILTFTTIIFSEIIPKAIGAHYAPRISRIVAPFLRLLVFLLYPLVLLLEKVVRLFKNGKRKVGTEDQIRALANLGGGAGHIDADERDLIHRAFVLNDRLVKEIMIPTERMVAVQKNESVRMVAQKVFRHHYSRLPVYGDTIDSIVGYVSSRDILEALADGREQQSISRMIRSLPFVSVEMRCDDLLTFLRKNQPQLAVVRDHEKKTVGLVSLEDVLEELIGEITGDK